MLCPGGRKPHADSFEDGCLRMQNQIDEALEEGSTEIGYYWLLRWEKAENGGELAAVL